MKKLQYSYTTPEESKLLMELGLPVDSADMFKNVKDNLFPQFVCYSKNGFWDYIEHGIVRSKKEKIEDFIPIWTVGRLIEIIEICYYKKQFRMEFCQDDEHTVVDNVIYCIKNALTLKQIDFSKLED